MNKQRAKALSKIISKLETIKEELNTLASDEREYYDNMPENMQQGDKGNAADEAAGNLESTEDDLQNVIDSITNALGDHA